MCPFKDRKNPWNGMEEAGCWREYKCGTPSGMWDGGPEGSYFISLVEAYPSPASGWCHNHVLSFPPQVDLLVTKET